MTTRSLSHAIFVIDRQLAASPERAFAAWADPETKRRWFACHDGRGTVAHELDFRVGGRERLSTGPPGGAVRGYDAIYQDIVPNERIVYGYAMSLDERRISVSLASVVFEPKGTGTRMVYTEQAVFLDGADSVADRKRGTVELLDQLEKALARDA